MAAPTRLELRTRSRIRADQDNSTFPTDVQFNYFLDEGGRETWFDLIQGGWPVAYTTTSITANGAANYVLNSGVALMGVLGVFVNIGGVVYPLKRVNPGKIAALRSIPAQGYAEFYELRVSPTQGPVIEFYPKPLSGSYSVDHIAEWPGFAGDGDVWYGPARSDELIVLRAAMKGCRKEGNLANELAEEHKELLTKVQAMASWFDMKNPAQIREAESTLERFNSFDYQVGVE